MNDDDDPLDVLRYIVSSGLADVFCNILVALCIVLSIPVTTAPAECSFPKLKIIKNSLHSTIVTEQHLSGLAVLSIENNVCKNLCKDDTTDQFAATKAREAPFP